MTRTNVCPSEDTLAAFAGGGLTDSALPRVLLHAADCSDCGVQLEAAGAPELLNGRYQLLRKLGEGGMGVVYEADDVVLGERVALKLLRHELSRDDRAFEYLKSEVKLARQVGHAHVCRVFDLGSQASAGTTVHYLSMELLRGPSLRSLLRQGALEPQLALRLADQILCGLHAAHAAGVLHRDLKPDNMLLRYPSPDEPHAVITDFGLARAFRAGQRHVTASRTLVGSAAYLAPEQVEEAPLTEASDIYSFGVVLFELLTARQPFQGETPLGVALKRLYVQPPRPSALRAELGQRYDAFLLRCLARDPELRFQSAVEARAALHALLDVRAASSRGPRTLGTVWRALCTACAMSLWFGAEHNATCTRELPSSGAAADRAEPASQPRAMPLTAATSLRPSASQNLEEPRAVQSTVHKPQVDMPRTAPPPDESPSAPTQRSLARLGSVRASAQGPVETGSVRGAGSPQPSAALDPARAARSGVLTSDGFLDPFAK